MKQVNLLFILLLTACNIENNSNNSNIINSNEFQMQEVQESRTFIDSLENDTYCYVKPLSDSTCIIQIGNEKFTRFQTFNISKWIVENKLQYFWHNEDFIDLGWSAGSDIGFDLLVPFDQSIPTQLYSNVLAYDSKKNRIAIEGNKDTSIVIIDLFNLKEQPVIVNPRCESMIIHSCITDIQFKNNNLSFSWINTDSIKEIKIEL